MADKAAIDFGNSNTVLAVWDEKAQTAGILRVPGFSLPDTFLIPSVISYEPDGRYFIGTQASIGDMAGRREFRWMKRYINLRSPYSLRVGEERIDARHAAEDFLNAAAAAFFAAGKEPPDELVLSVPVESFEHYSDWLMNSAKLFANTRLRLIDEATAAAAGYGLKLHPGDTLLVIDFGGSTLQAVCVSVSEEGEKLGRCCTVLGKAGCGIGGMTLDRWIYQDILMRLERNENDPLVRAASAELLRWCEKIKTELSLRESVTFDLFPEQNLVITRGELETLFRAKHLFDSIGTVIEEALRAAEDHGLRREDLTAVLPVGGSCLIPSVTGHIESLFPQGKILRGEPLGAVARGAAVIAGGMHIYDFIQHSYAIRVLDRKSGGYSFRPVVEKGTSYPQKQVGRTMRLKAAYDGQQRFGLSIYEIRESAGIHESRNEIFFSEEGAVQVMPLTEAERSAGELFWINEKDPLFLTTDTAPARGAPQFEVSFGIDANKMLTVTAKNLTSGDIVLKDHPVVRLV